VICWTSTKARVLEPIIPAFEFSMLEYSLDWKTDLGSGAVDNTNSQTISHMQIKATLAY
jgi:hypothetical protein